MGRRTVFDTVTASPFLPVGYAVTVRPADADLYADADERCRHGRRWDECPGCDDVEQGGEG